ncbi:MAG: SDR family oxidoreductase [Verrucomicrobiota bacterium]
MRVLIVGCGYIGLPLGVELVRQGHSVFGLKRSADDAELQAVGITPLHADITRAETLTGMPREFDWVVNCTASGGGDAEAYRQLYLMGNRNLIEWLRPSPPRRYVYTSSTSVYGQNDGSLVVETDPIAPATDTSQILVATENLLLAAAMQIKFPTVILRLAGIYGPGRGHWFKQFLRGEARLEGDGSRFLNMIHRDDVVGAIIAALQGGAPVPSVFNVVDNEPVMQRDFFVWLAGQLGKPMPPSVPADAEANRKRGVTNKRVSNQRLKKMLGYLFKYPTFRQGYAVEIARVP